jgi:hypothetical protein
MVHGMDTYVTGPTDEMASFLDDRGDEPPLDEQSPEDETLEVEPEEEAEEDAPVPAKPTSTRQPAQPRRPSTRSIVDVTLAINGLSATEAEVLADAVPAKVSATSVAQLSVAAIEHRATAMATLASVLEVAHADPVEAGIVAISLTEDGDKKLFGRVWAVLTHLSPGLGATPPHQTARAGLAMAVAAQGLDSTAESTIERIVTAVRGG